MSSSLATRLFDEIQTWTLIDPHTHINPHAPASQTLADILGYHYYTELAHSAGLSRSHIEDPGHTPRQKVAALFAGLGPIDNTIQWSWFLELAHSLFGFQGESVDQGNWEHVYELAEAKMSQADWEDQVLAKSKLESVFLTNDFDDPLQGFDTKRYIPCLRTDDLVFHLAKAPVRERLRRAAELEIHQLADLQKAIGHLFGHFRAHDARACAISLPPDFAPEPVPEPTAQIALERLLRDGDACDGPTKRTLAYWVFWTLAEHCAEFQLPFDLMIGVNRQVYPSGVYQGQDLYDSRVSMIQYAKLFNAFPQVRFPISVLASVTNQELVDYAWIFPNVITHGHWWYSNTPSIIRHDMAARLEAMPRTKQIGYYSDMYKLEFALPKFNMYKRLLAELLGEQFVIRRGWSEQRALELAYDVLRGNVERIFGLEATLPS